MALVAQLGALGFRPSPLPPTSPRQRSPGAGGSVVSGSPQLSVPSCPCAQRPWLPRVCVSVRSCVPSGAPCWCAGWSQGLCSDAPTTQTSAPGLVRRACVRPSRMLTGPLRWLHLYKETASNLPLACCVFMIREYRGQQREPQPGPVGQTTPQWGYEMGQEIRGSLES